jgi:hypothetical protein
MDKLKLVNLAWDSIMERGCFVLTIARCNIEARGTHCRIQVSIRRKCENGSFCIPSILMEPSFAAGGRPRVLYFIHSSRCGKGIGIGSFT